MVLPWSSFFKLRYCFFVSQKEVFLITNANSGFIVITSIAMETQAIRLQVTCLLRTRSQIDRPFNLVHRFLPMAATLVLRQCCSIRKLLTSLCSNDYKSCCTNKSQVCFHAALTASVEQYYNAYRHSFSTKDVNLLCFIHCLGRKQTYIFSVCYLSNVSFTMSTAETT